MTELQSKLETYDVATWSGQQKKRLSLFGQIDDEKSMGSRWEAVGNEDERRWTKQMNEADERKRWEKQMNE